MRTCPIAVLFGFCLAVFGCTTPESRQEHLAKTYCSSCHKFAEPELLAKGTWMEGVFPQMAFRMGLDPELIGSVPEKDHIYVIPTLPKTPMVTKEEFESIKKYFEREAPDSLIVDHPSDDTLRQFDAIPVSLSQDLFPLLSLLKVDTVNKLIYTCNRNSMLHAYDYNFALKDSLRLKSAASSILFSDDELVVTQMGIMDPNDRPFGLVAQIGGKSLISLIDSLQRPVFTDKADFDHDGLPDYVICEFGNYTGKLAVYENEGGNRFKQHVINGRPGSRKVVINDINKDGLPDMLVLFAQGDEQITLFINEGHFRFRTTTLLRFAPVYGSSYFEVFDFNHDGAFDLLYTNGDNADYSMVLKPYHGVRIFLNNGKNEFAESYFLPMQGCTQAIARDFDQDGDVDVAAIAFFPDFKKSPGRSFVYFENDNGRFTSFATPIAEQGRWLLMETVDIDSDSDLDILLGALNFNNGAPYSITKRWTEKPTSLLLMRNKRRQKA